MEKIDTDYKQQNWKISVKLFKPFNRDCAPSRMQKINTDYNPRTWNI